LKESDFGIRLANIKAMKTRFTYKELSLIAGILVAAIIVFTIWMNDTTTVSQTQQDAAVPHFSSQNHTVKVFKRLIEANLIIK
jgi:hypothetical protein